MCRRIKDKDIMLGIDTTHPHVTGRYATEMRAAAVRVHTGKLNASDKKILERSKKILQEYELEEE